MLKCAVYSTVLITKSVVFLSLSFSINLDVVFTVLQTSVESLSQYSSTNLHVFSTVWVTSVRALLQLFSSEFHVISTKVKNLLHICIEIFVVYLRHITSWLNGWFNSWIIWNMYFNLKNPLACILKCAVYSTLLLYDMHMTYIEFFVSPKIKHMNDWKQTFT